jgi:hypothetical protein
MEVAALCVCGMPLLPGDHLHRVGTVFVALVLLAKGWESPIEEGGR